MLRNAKKRLGKDAYAKHSYVSLIVHVYPSSSTYKSSLQDWEAKLRKRPIFKGSFIRPSMDNKLLPRLIPQPAHITGMILRRRIARERRWEQRETLKGWAHDLRHEGLFEYALLKRARGEAVGATRRMKGKTLESYADRCAGEVAQLLSKGNSHLPWAPVYTGEARTKWGERCYLSSRTTLTVFIRRAIC